MKKFIIRVTTNWCGMDQEYAAKAKKEEDLYCLAEDLAYSNFSDFCCRDDIYVEYDKDPDEMTLEEIEEFWQEVNEEDYYGWSIEEVNTPELEEEWEELYSINSYYAQ